MTLSTAKAVFKDPPRLSTERLTLRRIKRSDSADMFDYARDPEVTRYLLWSPHPDLKYTERYIDYIADQYKSGDFYDWAVICDADRRMIGTAGFTRFDFQNNSAEIGYVLSRKYWNQGYAPEAVAEVLRFGFTELNLHRIEARYMEGNTRSRRVMEKCGMLYEGTHRGSLYSKDRYQSVGTCAMLFDEYRLVNSK